MANAVKVVAEGRRIVLLVVILEVLFSSERALWGTARMLPSLMKQRRTELLGLPRGGMSPANNELDAGARWRGIWSQPA